MQRYAECRVSCPHHGSVACHQARGRDEMQNPEDFDWEIVCDRKTFESQKSDPAFQSIVVLSRAVNAIRFSVSALISIEGDNSPAALMQRINSFLYSSALLFEAFKHVQQTRDALAKYSKYKATLGVLLDDKEVVYLRKKLDPLRNQGVFHFNKDFIPKRVARLPVDSDGWYRFGRGRGSSAGLSYYDLSDRALLHAIVGGSDDEFQARYEVLQRKMTKILNKFIDGADQLIDSALQENGWTVRVIDGDADANTNT